MRKIVFITLLAVGILALAGCGTQKAVEKVDSVEEVVGTWERVGGSAVNYCEYAADGTYICAPSLDKIEQNVGFTGDYWFEEAQYMEQTTMGNCRAIGVYEILLQPNGNLKYVLMEDDCTGRIMDIIGAGDKKNSIEWKPVS